MNPDYKELAEFIHTNYQQSKFVGIADDGELFISFSTDDNDYRTKVLTSLKEKFPDKITKITLVEKLSIKQALQMIEELNKLLEVPQKKNLLDLEEF